MRLWTAAMVCVAMLVCLSADARTTVVESATNARARQQKVVIKEQYLAQGTVYDGYKAFVRADPFTNSLTLTFVQGTTSVTYTGSINAYSYTAGSYEVSGYVTDSEWGEVYFTRNALTGDYFGWVAWGTIPGHTDLLPV